jgi:cell division protein FtsI/penicillin-binding protein 2
VDAGFNIHLTIDPDAQRIVQQMSECYAGDARSCRQIGLANDRNFADYTNQMYEKAAVRMAAVALIDIPTGRIEALGSAHSDCFRQEYDGPARSPAGCPDLPSTPHYEPDRLLNHALFTDALPGSIIKPIMATGFLHDPRYRDKIIADRVSADFIRLQDELKGSDSAAFLNRMFCSDKAWANCDRPRDVQQAALLFGWDLGCLEPSFRCGRLNVLFGYPDARRIREDSARMPLGTSVMYGRLLTEPVSLKRSADFQMMRNFSFDPKLAAACSRGDYYSGSGQNRGWRKCRHGHLVYIESEGWGQGNARTTALGAAGMMARLAAAANGQASLRLPYLVDRISDADAQKFDLAAHQLRLADPVKLEIPQQDAALIVRGMISHKAQGTPAGSRSGTANAACIRVFDAATCNRIDWIAGKTGTPPYGNDGLTLKEIRQKCRLAPSGNVAYGEQQEWWTSCSREQPYKWYVAVFKTDDGQSGFNKAVAVLTERNWYRSGPLAGKVQSPGDHDAMNVSAEMAFRIMARMRTGTIQAQADGRGKS